MKNTTNNPKIGNGLVQLIRIDKTFGINGLKPVNMMRKCHIYRSQTNLGSQKITDKQRHTRKSNSMYEMIANLERTQFKEPHLKTHN